MSQKSLTLTVYCTLVMRSKTTFGTDKVTITIHPGQSVKDVATRVAEGYGATVESVTSPTGKTIDLESNQSDELDRNAPADMRIVAEEGFNAPPGSSCPYGKTQPAAWLWRVGEYLREQNGSTPTGVRFGGGFIIHANQMLFDVGDPNTIVCFPRI